jgi:arylsulfatase A-like enzyme
MSHYAIHAPWEKDDRYYQKYIAAGLSEFDAAYASMIESMDKSLGDIMANVKKHGIENNTLIVFMSDNGQPSQAALNKPLRGHKLTPYEGGVRVPFIASWPGNIESGATNNTDYVIIEDIFPTFLEFAGVADFDKKSIDGISFASFLKGKTQLKPERAIFWHFPHTYDQPAYSSVRKGDWKLIYQHFQRKLELYNLIEDIGEETDLSDMNPEKTNELALLLGNHLRNTKAGMPIDKATGEPIPYPDEAND